MISKQEFKNFIKNAFEKNDKDVINAFVDTYNQHFKDAKIYNVTTCGEYGLQGFVQKGADLVLGDLGYIYEDYKANTERNTYFFFDTLGGLKKVVDYLDGYTAVVYEDTNARSHFIGATKLGSIMDTTNGHSKKYVDLINEVWNNGNKGMWKQILFAIAYRDKAEMHEKDIYVETLEDAYDNADLILMRVCDNEDLEMILHYFSYL